MRTRLLLVASALVLAMVGAGCEAVTPYAAKVNGERITVGDLERELSAIRGNKQYLEAVESDLAVQGRKALGAGNATFTTSFVSQVLTRRIFLELVHQAVRERRLRVDADDRRQARRELEQSFGDPKLLNDFDKDFLEELVQFTAEINVLRAALHKDVTDAQVKKFYDENANFFEQACFREAITGNFESVDVPPDQDAQAKAAAEDVKRRVDAGEDFAGLSEDRGCVAAESVAPTLRPALSEMQPGEVRGPIRTDRGYHVVQLLERKKQPLEEAEAQIRRFLQQQQQGAFDEFLKEAVEKAEITVSPRYGTFDKAGPAVVPPQAPTTTSTSAPARRTPPPSR
jgi:peptidyl-prolyl cis-trans isomerase SurA